MAEREPILAEHISPLITRGTDMERALALRLAEGLALTENMQDSLSETLLQALKAHPNIADAAAKELEAIRSNDPASRSHAQAFLSYKGFHALQVARIAGAFWNEGREELAAWLSNRASAAFGPDIHPAARLGAGIMLDHGSGIVIGETAVIEDGVSIMQNVTLGGTGKVRGDRHPKVRQGVVIGAGANIIGNIELGAFSKIGAGSVVLRDVPAQCTVVGIPAQIVRPHRGRDLAAEQSLPGTDN